MRVRSGGLAVQLQHDTYHGKHEARDARDHEEGAENVEALHFDAIASVHPAGEAKEDADGVDGYADQRDIDPKAPSPGRLAGEN